MLCDIRDHGPLAAEVARARPDLVFHLAAYKHVDWAEIYPDEFLDTNLHGSWNVLRAADEAGVGTVVVASTDKAALAASYYGRTKRFMEQLTAYAARAAARAGWRSASSTCSAARGAPPSCSCARRAAGVPLTITDTGMLRYWITMAHAVTAAAHAALLASKGVLLATPAGAPELTVGELATRIWRGAGHEGEPGVDLLGIRRGETLNEVLVGAGETLGDEHYAGVAAIDGRVLDGRGELGGGAHRDEDEPRSSARSVARGDGAAGADSARPAGRGLTPRRYATAGAACSASCG